MPYRNELTRIERDLVLQYLRDDNVPLTVTLEDKPEQSETQMQDNSISDIQPDKVPASAIFPVAIPSEQIEVLDQGIILLKNTNRSVAPFLGKNVKVQFYFNHLGLYFITTMKECSKGLAIVVPASIKRIPDINITQDFEFSGALSFLSDDGKNVNVSCIPKNGYRLFAIPKWDEIPEENQKDAKSLLERFVSDVKNGAVPPAGNGIQLISIVKALTDSNISASEAVEGRQKPLEIIYVDGDRIVLYSDLKKDFISFKDEFTVSLNFSLAQNRLLKRTIKIPTVVENIYEDIEKENSQICYSLKYSELKTEDRRFLYERITGKKLV